MKKIILILIAVALVGGIGYYFLSQKKDERLVSPQNIVNPTPTPELATWDDPAAFTFEYPKELTLDKHPENKTDYAQVELKSEKHSGGITVWVKDTNAKLIDDYLKQNKIETSLDTNLGDIAAKKYTDSKDSTLVHIVTLQFGYLYQIDIASKDSYWKDVSTSVINSFKFKEPTPTTASSDDTPYIPSDEGGGDEVIE